AQGAVADNAVYPGARRPGGGIVAGGVFPDQYEGVAKKVFGAAAFAQHLEGERENARRLVLVQIAKSTLIVARAGLKRCRVIEVGYCHACSRLHPVKGILY